jgi:hypothetical protein
MIKKLISELAQLWVLESIILYILHRLFFYNKNYFNPRKKNKLFICGSGWSINNISEIEWIFIENNYDVMSFNEFYKCDKVRIDFHLIREIELNYFGKISSRFHSIFNFKALKQNTHEISINRKMDNTIFFVLNDFKSGSALLWDLLNRNRKKIYYSNTFIRNKNKYPSFNISNISHRNSTLFDCINLGVLMGYSDIVLAGIDLNDRRYFYLAANETRDFDLRKGSTFQNKHATADETFQNILCWNKFLLNRNIRLSVLNPSSMLAQILPITKL